MYLIFDNISNKDKLYLALVESDKIIKSSTTSLGFGQGEKILSILNNFFKKNKIKPFNLKGIILNIGPGSYTSLRLAVLMANTWAYINKTSIYGFKQKDFKNVKKLIALIKNKKPTNFIEPFYGRAPKISQPKNKLWTMQS